MRGTLTAGASLADARFQLIPEGCPVSTLTYLHDNSSPRQAGLLKRLAEHHLTFRIDHFTGAAILLTRSCWNPLSCVMAAVRWSIVGSSGYYATGLSQCLCCRSNVSQPGGAPVELLWTISSEREHQAAIAAVTPYLRSQKVADWPLEASVDLAAAADGR